MITSFKMHSENYRFAPILLEFTALYQRSQCNEFNLTDRPNQYGRVLFSQEFCAPRAENKKQYSPDFSGIRTNFSRFFKMFHLLLGVIKIKTLLK